MATMSARYTVIDGEVVAQERGGVRHQLVPDPLGSTVALYDNSGTKTDTFGYWPYGESSARTGTTSLPFQYVGIRGYYRNSSSQDYIRARYLDKTKGKWVTEDPDGFVNNEFNPYIYSYCNPMTHIDSSGRAPDCDKCKERFGKTPSYPGWQKIIASAIAKYCKNCPNLTNDVFTCVIFAESNGNPNEMTSGNFGLTQISYGDWKYMCQGIGSWEEVKKDPAKNIECGIKFQCQHKNFKCDPHQRGTQTGPGSKYECCRCCKD